MHDNQSQTNDLFIDVNIIIPIVPCTIYFEQKYTSELKVINRNTNQCLGVQQQAHNCLIVGAHKQACNRTRHHHPSM